MTDPALPATLSIRGFRPGDAGALAALFHASVHQIGARDYSAPQLEAWSPAPPDPGSYLLRARACTCLVAVRHDGTIAGYGTLTADGHVDHLFCRADLAGSGVGSALLHALEQASRAAGLTAFTIDASEGARRLAMRRGYRVIARNEVTRRGIVLHNYRMEKRPA